MKLVDFLEEAWVIPELHGKDKTAVLKELSDVLVEACQTSSSDELLQVLLERERLGSTGIGEGIAIPHGRLKKLKGFHIAFGRSIEGVDFESIDHKPSQIFFLVMAPEHSTVDNLNLLGRIVTLLKDTSLRKQLLGATSRRELFQAIVAADEKY